MTDRMLIITGFATLAVLAVALEIAARLLPHRLITLRATLALTLRSRPVRVLAVLVWAWLGWHFLAR
ncbi:DUF6186 family protein [Nocardia sp. NPDC020380]|uniref:DUF6186 family protein n=1 Tax=Nocardia sp. NPDC020380 TaxID=3364309 RepID=UPI0037B0229E